MPKPGPIKPAHKAIQTYYAALKGYGAHEVEHEMALRSAFQNLLDQTARLYKWFLIPEQRTKAGGKSVRPDGTLCDDFNLPRGYWEAKDEDDDLDVEITKKIAKGYPLTNTIFEDTRRAVLFQNRRETFRADLTDAQQHSDALAYFITFHTYGSWLHGRAEGSVDLAHNVPGTPVLSPDEARERSEFLRLKAQPVTLNAKSRGVVDRTVREVCEHRGWLLHAVNVRTNHVHIVVTATATPEKVMNDLKAYATRRLVEAKCIPTKSKVWSRHGSTRYVWDDKTFEECCKYVVEGQGSNLPSESEPPSDSGDPALAHARGSEKPPCSDSGDPALAHARGSEKPSL